MTKIKLITVFIIFLYSCSDGNNDNETKIESKEKQDSIVEKDYSQEFFNEATQEATNQIRKVIEDKVPEERIKVSGTGLYSSVLIPKFYLSNAFYPAWITSYNDFDVAFEMINFISDVKNHGLLPQDYHIDELRELKMQLISDSSAVFNAETITKIDVLLTDAFLMLSSHLNQGKVNPETFETEWGIRRDKPELEIDEKLIQFLEEGSVVKNMNQFYPTIFDYELLIEKAKWITENLEKDKKLLIPEAKLSLDIHTDSTYNHLINEKLTLLGYSTTDNKDSLELIFNSIKKFQKHHGLNTDGKIGKLTLEALNIPLQTRLDQLYVNMERLRWLPEKGTGKRVLVNIADFTLDYLENNDTLIHMRTVVGQNFRKTPVFNAKMSYLVFSPTWTVPPGILRKDILPAVAKDISYLSSKGMIVKDRSGNVVNPASIDWKKANASGRFPYTIQQMPGNQNALGRVKFMFPNKYSVYLHDTPSKSLFARDERNFSSGCIRVEKPLELAELLLQETGGWNTSKIANAMNQSTEKTVLLKTPIDVYIYYLTCWSHNGKVEFRKDIYNRDSAVLKALQEINNNN